MRGRARSCRRQLVAIALGLGVNLSVERFPEGIDAISLHTLVPAPPSAGELLELWGSAFGLRVALLEQGGIGALLADWRRVAVGLGGPVTVHSASGVIEGVALDVGEDGALLVEASGRTHRFLAADVHLGVRPPDGQTGAPKRSVARSPARAWRKPRALLPSGPRLRQIR